MPWLTEASPAQKLTSCSCRLPVWVLGDSKQPYISSALPSPGAEHGGAVGSGAASQGSWVRSASLPTMLRPFPGNGGTAASQPWELAFRREKACISPEASDNPLWVLSGEFGGLHRADRCSLLSHPCGRTSLPIQAQSQHRASPNPSCSLVLPAPASARQGGRPGGRSPMASGRAGGERRRSGAGVRPSPADISKPPSISASTPGLSPTHASLCAGRRTGGTEFQQQDD